MIEEINSFIDELIQKVASHIFFMCAAYTGGPSLQNP